MGSKSSQRVGEGAPSKGRMGKGAQGEGVSKRLELGKKGSSGSQ